MSEPTGNNIKKSTTLASIFADLLYSYDLGFTLLPEVGDVCTHVCAYTQADPGI